MESNRFDNFIIKKFDSVAKLNSEHNVEIEKIARKGIVKEIVKLTSSNEFEESLLGYIIENSKDKLKEMQTETEKMKNAISSLEKRKNKLLNKTEEKKTEEKKTEEKKTEEKKTEEKKTEENKTEEKTDKIKSSALKAKEAGHKESGNGNSKATKKELIGDNDAISTTKTHIVVDDDEDFSLTAEIELLLDQSGESLANTGEIETKTGDTVTTEKHPVKTGDDSKSGVNEAKNAKKIEMIDIKKIKKENSSDLKAKPSRKRKAD